MEINETRGERIKQIRKELGLTMKEFGEKIGAGATAVSNYEVGYRRPKIDILDAIADLGNCTIDWLEGKSDVRNPIDYQSVYDAGVNHGKCEALSAYRNIPVFSGLSCGPGAMVEESPDEYIGVPVTMITGGSDYFCNPAEGDSMLPGIRSGDYLIFERSDSVEPGKIGSFSLNGEYYCKRFMIYQDGTCWLLSDNTAYPPIPIHEDDDFRTLGLYRYKLSKEQ